MYRHWGKIEMEASNLNLPLGSIRRATELGFDFGCRYILHKCEGCGKIRWVQCYKGKANRQFCRLCAIANKQFKVAQKVMHKYGLKATPRQLSKNGYKSLSVLSPCIDCGKERWINIAVFRKNGRRRCNSCAAKFNYFNNPPKFGEDTTNWKGGRMYREGYILLKLLPNDFFLPMANSNRYVLEHRYIMAKSLNRHLLPWEVVHHRNGIKDDNRLENLQLLPSGKYHLLDTSIKTYIKYLEERIKKLEEQCVTSAN